jgi:hypothetical protein
VRLLVETTGGVWTLDPESGESDDFAAGASLEPVQMPRTGLPRVVAASAAGSTVVAAVDSKPPLLVSHDAGTTWRDAGRGLPIGSAVAICEAAPDRIAFASGTRLWVSRDGGRFWTRLEVELDEEVVALDWSGEPGR